jgi:hypothetical protein
MNLLRTSTRILFVAALVSACSDDTNNANPDGGPDAAMGAGAKAGSGSGGKASGGSAGSAGKAGSGNGGTAGAAGAAGSAGKAGTTGAGGSGGSKPDAGPDGSMDGGGPPAPPPLGAQIDRMGRPAINTALNNSFNPDAMSKGKAKDAYNAAAPAKWSTFQDEFEKNLAILDGLDTNCCNQLLAGDQSDGGGRYATLASVLTDDQLYVNTAASECGVYLGVEAEAVKVVPAGGGKCGGRTPKDDVIERSYSVLAAGILTGVDDGITMDDGAQTATFPFLGEPNLADK